MGKLLVGIYAVIALWAFPSRADNQVFDSDPREGKYLCITDYVAGIGKDAGGNDFAGSLIIPPEDQKFFITLKKVDEKLDSCFSADTMEALRQYKLFRPMNDPPDKILERMLKEDSNKKCCPIDDPNNYADWCLANYKADFSDSGGPLYSFDGFNYYGRSTLVTNFLVVKMRAGVVFRLYSEPYEYVARGRCELIQ